MSTQGNGEEGFELVTSASLSVVYSQLIYSFKKKKKEAIHDINMSIEIGESRELEDEWL
jgi:hypothetical protein